MADGLPLLIIRKMLQGRLNSLYSWYTDAAATARQLASHTGMAGRERRPAFTHININPDRKACRCIDMAGQCLWENLFWVRDP